MLIAFFTTSLATRPRPSTMRPARTLNLRRSLQVFLRQIRLTIVRRAAAAAATTTAAAVAAHAAVLMSMSGRLLLLLLLLMLWLQSNPSEEAR